MDPANIQGLHNLCVVMVERGKLGLAAQCLERAAIIAPQQDYVHRHLAIVKARIERLTPEQRENQKPEESFWEGITFDENVDDPPVEPFLEKSDSVFMSRSIHHRKTHDVNTETSNKRVKNLKNPTKSSSSSRIHNDNEKKNESNEKLKKSSNLRESNSGVIDDILNNDLDKLEVSRMHGNNGNEQFNHSAGNSHSQKKVSAFS